MTIATCQDSFLRPYLRLVVQNHPAIYFFLAKRTFFQEAETFYQLIYLGKTGALHTRLGWSHHILKKGYRPNLYLQLPLHGADKDDLTAAENCFLLFYRPELNRDHMPRVGFGDPARWARRLINRLGCERHASFYRFLLKPEPEVPEAGRPMWDVLCRELAAVVPEEEQFRIARGLLR